MTGVNFTVLVGNVGREPEIRTTNAGAKVAGFSLATNETWRDRQTGEKRERTEWHRIVVWGPASGDDGLVGVVERFVKKGSRLFIMGQSRTREWEDQAGSKRYTTEVHLQGFGAQLVLLDSAGGGRPGLPDSPDQGGAPAPERSLAQELDDEIPF